MTSFSAYFDDKEGVLVTENRVIFKRYLTGWFLIDVIASLPYSLVEELLRIYDY